MQLEADAELCFLPAYEAAELIRARALSPKELVDVLLARIDALNPRVRAYLTVAHEVARCEAAAAERRLLDGELRGPLDGIPCSIKDLDSTAGVRTTFGSRWYADHVPDEDGLAVGRLRSTGAVLLGKTNTPQFGHSDRCDNLLGPPAVNPWRLDRTTGGSSGGAAAAVAAGLGPIALASDGGGSIRIPAAFCGVFGLKPSAGRIPAPENGDQWAGFASKGPITRTVRDAALLMDAVAGPDPHAPLSIETTLDYLAACDGDLRGVRVAWSPDLGYASVDPEVLALAQAAALRFGELGAEVEAPEVAWPDVVEFHWSLEIAHAIEHADRFLEHPDWMEPMMQRRIVAGLRRTTDDYRRAVARRTELYRVVCAFFDRYDLLITPTMPTTAWEADPAVDAPVDAATGRKRELHERVPFSYPFSIVGYPAASVPCGFASDGLPVGIQIAGGWHADALVLRASAAFEALQPWAGWRPLQG